VRPVVRRWAWPGLTAIGLCAILTVGLSFPPGSTWLLEMVRGASGPRVPASQTVAAER